MHKQKHRVATIVMKPPHQSQHDTSYALHYIHRDHAFEHRQEIILVFCDLQVFKQTVETGSLVSHAQQWIPL